MHRISEWMFPNMIHHMLLYARFFWYTYKYPNYLVTGGVMLLVDCVLPNGPSLSTIGVAIVGNITETICTF
jgi:hypothetical protein